VLLGGMVLSFGLECWGSLTGLCSLPDGHRQQTSDGGAFHTTSYGGAHYDEFALSNQAGPEAMQKVLVSERGSGAEVQEASPGEAPPTQGIDDASLKASMNELASRVGRWDAGRFTFVERLQASPQNFGCIDKMEDSRDGRRVVVKRMPNAWIRASPAEFERTYEKASERPWLDLGILMELNRRRYPWACELLDVLRDREHTYVMTTLAMQGDLFSWCTSKPAPGAQREGIIAPVAAQVLSAVRWLHNLGVAHRDLSLENVVLAEDNGSTPQVKLIDFAMATTSRMRRHELRGKPSYQAPEMHTEAEYDAFLTDAFAVGVVVYALAVQGYPWDSTDRRSRCQGRRCAEESGLRKLLALKRQKNCGGKCIIEVMSRDLVSLLVGLLEFDPGQRFHLGEDCMQGKEQAWRSVWLSNWLQESELGSAAHRAEIEAASSRCGDSEEPASWHSKAEPEVPRGKARQCFPVPAYVTKVGKLLRSRHCKA